MMHMLLGISAKTIGKSPYAPIFTGSRNILASEIGIKISKKGRLYCLPSVSSYIGADIVAGAYVCDLQHKKGNVLFIDIGTNGEIVLSKAGKLLSCSCAAGPALEGMNISSGMRASEGAIEDIEIINDSVNIVLLSPSLIVGRQKIVPKEEVLVTPSKNPSCDVQLGLPFFKSLGQTVVFDFKEMKIQTWKKSFMLK